MESREYAPIRATWFIVILSAMILACADTPDGGGGSPTPNDSTSASISRTKGMVGKYFSAKVNVYSSFIDSLEFDPTVDGKVPDGVTWNSSRGVFEGTPTLAGFYNVRIRYRDSNKYHSSHPGDSTWWYYLDVELAIYDELEEG